MASLQSLPNEVLETILLFGTELEKHNIRSNLRAASRELHANIPRTPLKFQKPNPVSKSVDYYMKYLLAPPKRELKTVRGHWRKDVKVEFLLRNGKSPAWILDNKLATKYNLMLCAVRTGDLSVVVSARKVGCSIGLASVRAAVENSYVNILRYFSEQRVTIDRNLCYIAAQYGHLPVLEFIISKYSIDDNQIVNAMEAAAANDNIQCLQFLHQTYGNVWDKMMSLAAAKCGSVACLDYCRSNGCELDWPAIIAHSIINGHLNCITYACTVMGKTVLGQGAARMAVAYGQLHILMYLHKVGYTFDSEVATVAAASGKLACLQFCHQAGAALTVEAINQAAYHGHITCMQYLIEAGCMPSYDTCIWAAFKGQLDCLKLSHQFGGLLDNGTATQAIIGRSPECLIYACENGISLQSDLNACAWAVHTKDLSMLKLVRILGAPWTETIVPFIVDLGLYHFLTYVIPAGCPWGQPLITIPKYCIANPQIRITDFTRYMEKYGCPWSIKTSC